MIKQRLLVSVLACAMMAAPISANAQIFGPSDEEKAQEAAQDQGIKDLQDKNQAQDERIKALEEKVQGLTESLSQATGANEELGHQIQQQATGDGQPQSRHRGIEGGAGDGFDSGEPAADRVGDHTVKRLLALGRSGVALEKQSLQVPQFGPVQVRPHGGERFRRICRQIDEQTHLAALDLFDDRHE